MMPSLLVRTLTMSQSWPRAPGASMADPAVALPGPENREG
jgi:hypothetical protein